MNNTLILLNSDDCKELETLTWELLNVIAEIKKINSDEARIDRDYLLKNILDICTRYEKAQKYKNIEAQLRYVVSFLLRLASSQEWSAPHIYKRAADIANAV